MHPSLCVALGVTACSIAFYHFVFHVCRTSEMSGDRFYIRQMAYGHGPISAPYCWRPLHPFLSRYLSFSFVSYGSLLVTTSLIWDLAGGGWTGTALVIMYATNKYLLLFNVKNPEYAESLGHLLLAATVWSTQSGTLVLTIMLLLLSGLTRESLAVMASIVAFVTVPHLAWIPIASGALAYFQRDEDLTNQHPLIEKTPYETLKRWLAVKGDNVVHYAHSIQGIRGSVFAVPFVWDRVTVQDRLGLLVFLPAFFFGLPASAATRQIGYCFVVLIPFIAAFDPVYLWAYTILCVFWPIDYRIYDESGGNTFQFLK